MLKKLRIQFVAFTMLLATLLLGVIFGLVYYFTSQSLQAETEQTIQAIAADPFRLGSLGSGQEAVKLPYFALQIGHFGEVLATGGGYYDLSDEAYLLEVVQAVVAQGADAGVLEEYGLRYACNANYQGQCWVFVDISSEQATLQNLVRNCAIIGLLGLLAVFGISLLLARIAVRPVERAWDQQRQFVADASHELKTPLTVILTNAELLQSPEQDAAAKGQFAASIQTMAHQMRGLVENLLALARVDNGAVQTKQEPVELGTLIEDALLPFEPLLFERELLVESRLQPDLTVQGSRSHLRQVVEILLDNAMKYAQVSAGELGTVKVSLIRQGSHALLTVANPGPAIANGELEKIFQRFYRVDAARAMDHSYGLGLSIAREIVQGHRGKIWARSCQGWNSFFVQLPIL